MHGKEYLSESTEAAFIMALYMQMWMSVSPTMEAVSRTARTHWEGSPVGAEMDISHWKLTAVVSIKV